MTDVGALTTALGAVDALLARATEETPIEVLANNLRSAVGEMDRSSIPMTLNALGEGNVTSPEALAAAKTELTGLIAAATAKREERPASRSQERRARHRGR